MYDEFLDGEDKEEVQTPEELIESELTEKNKKRPGKANTFFVFLFGIILGVAISLVAVTVIKGKAFSSNSREVLSQVTGDDSVDVTNSKLAYLVNLIDYYYYKDIDTDTLVNGVYKGLFEALDDPYTEYYTPEEYQSLMTYLTGDYAGIGALLSKNKDTGIVTISKVYKNTPAEESGLRDGDTIVAADEYQGVELDLDEFVQHIRGEAGTKVTLHILRDGQEMDIEVTRDHVITPTVEYSMLSENTGYIAISQFNSGTYDEFVAAYEDLQSQGMEKVIFDMRSNGGGMLDSVVKVLDYLLPDGTVVYTEDKYGKREDFTSDNDQYVAIPITVLVDENTASAAEIFTGAIRDFDYGTIIGTTTFGKGIVQSTVPLPDGSAIKLTTSSYYTPSGECIHGVGIKPDIELEFEFLGGDDDTYSYDLDNQIQKALEVLGAANE